MRNLTKLFGGMLVGAGILLACGLGIVLAAGSGLVPPLDVHVAFDDQRQLDISTPLYCPSGLSSNACAEFSGTLARSFQLSYHEPAGQSELVSVKLPRWESPSVALTGPGAQ